MEGLSFPEITIPLKTRADLKRELMRTVPEGEEVNFLEHAEIELQESRESLHALRTERVKLMRQISIRKRKMQDWKSKIPRTEEPTYEAAQREIRRVGEAPCCAVARVEICDHGEQRLLFHKMFWVGLTGLAGFGKAWLILSGDEHGVVADGLGLVLVDIRRVDVGKGLVEVHGLGDECHGVEVIDIKPYLAYCEAFRDGEEEGEVEDGDEDEDGDGDEDEDEDEVIDEEEEDEVIDEEEEDEDEEEEDEDEEDDYEEEESVDEGDDADRESRVMDV